MLLDAHDRLVCGPFPVAGRSGDKFAALRGNPARNPLLRYGDTPEGIYRVTGFVGTGTETSHEHDRGPHEAIVIEAVSGDAALAEANGRYRLLIQGGAAGIGGQIRSTAGSLRLCDDDQAALLAALDGAIGITCECIRDAAVENTPLVTIDDGVVEYDPPQYYVDAAGRTLASPSVSSRRAMLVGTGGMALSLAVSFVTLDVGLPVEAVAQTY